MLLTPTDEEEDSEDDGEEEESKEEKEVEEPNEEAVAEEEKAVTVEDVSSLEEEADNSEEASSSEEDESEEEGEEEEDGSEEDEEESEGEEAEESGDETGESEAFEDEPEHSAEAEEQAESGDDEEDTGDEESGDDTETGNEDETTGDEETSNDETGDEETGDSSEATEEFEDEPGAIVAAKSSDEEESESDDEDESDDDEKFEDEEEYPEQEVKEKSKGNQTNIFVLLLCCFCCILIIVVIVVIYFVVIKDDDPKGPVPSAMPSFLPSALPTPSPTRYVWPTIVFPIIADTYMRGGDSSSINFGKAEELQIQTGPTENATAYTLLQFDTSDLPADDVPGLQRKILLHINHIAVDANRGPTQVVVSKLDPQQALTQPIEDLTWEQFNPKVNQVGPTFTVSPADPSYTPEQVIDITDLVAPPNAVLRGRRNLQATKLLLMLESQRVDEKFYSRERLNGSQKAEITHDYVTFAPTQAPSISPQPSASAKPSFRPSVSSKPTITASPTVTPEPTAPTSSPSENPTQTPTVSNAPSVSSRPSSNPTISNAPSKSSKPSPSPTMQPSVNPTLSQQPTTCLEQLIPPQTDIRGASDNPFPDGAFEYAEQPTDGKTVTVKIIQKWSTSNVVWIAPYYADFSLPENENRYCEKTRNVAPDQELVYTFQCFKGYAIFNVIVSDTSLVPGNDLLMDEIPGCESSQDDNINQKVAYAFNVKCTPPSPECLEIEI